MLQVEKDVWKSPFEKQSYWAFKYHIFKCVIHILKLYKWRTQTLQGSWGSMFLDRLKFDKIFNLISQMSDTGTILCLVYDV